MPSAPESAFAAWLRNLLGEDPGALLWPRQFTVPGPGGERPALYDPHNALLQLYDVGPVELADRGWRPVLEADDVADPPCSRVVVFARPGAAAGWTDLGFGREAVLPGFWADRTAAELWARNSASRPGLPVRGASAVAASAAASLPEGWTCRRAGPADAPAIRDLLAEVFHDYPIPADPAVVAYALLEGDVSGRVVEDPDGDLAAYASLEAQPGEGAVEMTDCVTRPADRGRGLMTHVVTALQADPRAVHGVYALVREDSPAMLRVFRNAGWDHAGRLAAHYRVGGAWVSAQVVVAP